MGEVTIVIPISRSDYAEKLFHSLEMLTCNREKTNLLTYVDGDWRLFEKIRNMTIQSKFNERLCVQRNKGLPQVGSVPMRRKRIADIHNELVQLLNKADYLFFIEDDTLVPSNALEKLLRGYATYPYAGFISGIELGRWGFPHLGAWKVDDVYEPKTITSIPKGTDYESVDAAGFYCFLTKFDTYKNHTFKLFEDVLGPDVDFGITLRQQGLLNYVDHSIQCAHLSKDGPITLTNTEPVQVQFEKAATINRGTKWLMKTL